LRCGNAHAIDEEEEENVEEGPKILVLLGSDSDIPLIEDGLNLLKEMGVRFRLDLSSAHRHPEKTAAYAKNARTDGIEVIIAAAGLAAHLPGVIAAHTTLPVIGIPLKGGSLLGFDALLSIVQMPKGVPVATVGIDASRNACILACEILSIKYDQIRQRLDEMKERMREEIERKSAELCGDFLC
jgi:5-(carboxyamino)imidazole ribonucleotide mutase